MRIFVLPIIYFIFLFKLSGQEIHLLDSNKIVFGQLGELKWAEFKIHNSSCDTLHTEIQIPHDSLVLGLQLFINNEKTTPPFLVPPDSSMHLKCMFKLHQAIAEDALVIYFPKDTFHLQYGFDPTLKGKAHCFPLTSSGWFKLYYGLLKNPQTIVMNRYREILLENTGTAPFLDLHHLASDTYIIQIGEDEFLVKKE